jgi:hypothetical protein
MKHTVTYTRTWVVEVEDSPDRIEDQVIQQIADGEGIVSDVSGIQSEVHVPDEPVGEGDGVKCPTCKGIRTVRYVQEVEGYQGVSTYFLTLTCDHKVTDAGGPMVEVVE